MVNQEGIVFGGYFLYEAEFKKIFQEFWNSELKNIFIEKIQTIIKNYLIEVNGNILAAKNLKALYNSWEQINTEVFGNTPVSLLGILKWDKEYHYTFVNEESDLINRYTSQKIRVNKALMEKYRTTLNTIYQSNIEMALEKHFEDMKNSINKVKLTKVEGHNIHLALGKYYKNTEWYKRVQDTHMTNKSLFDIFYSGNKVAAQGQMYDAFINHVSRKHVEYLRALNNLENPIIVSPFEKSVYNEEGRWNFIQLVMDSLNSTAWYRGGDAIAADNRTRKILFNIQVKSGTKGRSWDIASIQFLTFINTLNSYLNKTGQDIAAFLYENLKITMATSIDNKKIDEDLEKEILDNVRKNLKLSGLTIN